MISICQFDISACGYQGVRLQINGAAERTRVPSLNCANSKANQVRIAVAEFNRIIRFYGLHIKNLSLPVGSEHPSIGFGTEIIGVCDRKDISGWFGVIHTTCCQ